MELPNVVAMINGFSPEGMVNRAEGIRYIETGQTYLTKAPHLSFSIATSPAKLRGVHRWIPFGRE